MGRTRKTHSVGAREDQALEEREAERCWPVESPCVQRAPGSEVNHHVQESAER